MKKQNKTEKKTKRKKQKEKKLKAINNNILEQKVFQSGDYFLPFGCEGRENEMNDLVDLVRSGNVPVVVCGVAGIGKTTLCSMFYKEQKKKNTNFNMPFVNLTSCKTMRDFDVALSIAVGLKYENKIVVRSQLIENILSNKPDAIYFDNWEDLQNNLIDKDEWNELYAIINQLSINGIAILISSQENAPRGWKNYPIGLLDPQYGRSLFLRILNDRNKSKFEFEEKLVLDKLLQDMENHPLTIVLTASLIEGESDSLVRIARFWSEANDITAPGRHRSMRTALRMSYETVSKVPNAVELWGLFAELENDFPKIFLEYLQEFFSEKELEYARQILYHRNLISYSKNGQAIHMLLSVKLQWEELVPPKKVMDCMKQWGRLIPLIMNASEMMSNFDENNILLKKNILLSGVSFMKLIQRLIELEIEKEIIELCIESMKNYYEALSESAYAFLSSLPADYYSERIQAIIYKNLGDICRLRDGKNPEIAEKYYELSLELYKRCDDKYGYADVLNSIGQNLYWNYKQADEAMGYLKLSEETSRDLDYTYGIAEALKNQGIILTEDYKKYDLAMKCYNESRDLYEQIKDYRGIAHTIKRTGIILDKEENYEDAANYYTEALDYYKKAHFYQGQGDTISRLCYVYTKLKRYDDLLLVVNEGNNIQDKMPYNITKKDLQKSISYAKQFLDDLEIE